MGKRGSEQFNPVRKDLMKLFSELQPMPDQTVVGLQEVKRPPPYPEATLACTGIHWVHQRTGL